MAGNNGMATNKGVAFMQQLLDAEKASEILISDAKTKRLARLRSAKHMAEEAVDRYKEEQEEKHQRESGKKATADPTAELKNATQAGINLVHLDYRTHGEAAVEYITAKVLDVPTTLTDTQKQSLRADVVPIPACRAVFSGYHSHVQVTTDISTTPTPMSTSRGLGDEPMMSTSRGLGDEPVMSVKLSSKSDGRLFDSIYSSSKSVCEALLDCSKSVSVKLSSKSDSIYLLKAYVIPVVLFTIMPLVMDR